MNILHLFGIKPTGFPKFCLCSLLKPIFSKDTIQSPKLSFKNEKNFVFYCITRRNVTVTVDFKVLDISKGTYRY